MPMVDRTRPISTDLTSEEASSQDTTDEMSHAQELYNCEGLSFGPFDNKYKILHTLGGGSFGHVFVGENCLGEAVAIKGEMQGTGCEKLLKEGNLYTKLQGYPGIPIVYWYGMHGNKYNFMVMEKCGKSLQELFLESGKKLSIQTVVHIALQLIDAIKGLHDNNIIHRDISPGNILIGSSDDPQKLLLIDFGLATSCQSNGKLRMPMRGIRYHRQVVGTPHFISVGIHNGDHEGRHDDLESIAYLLIFLLKGQLPWSRVKAHTRDEAILKIGKLKASVSMETLAENIPAEFVIFLDYARKLKTADVPDYDGLKVLFTNLAKKEGIDLEKKQYDWDSKNPMLNLEKIMTSCVIDSTKTLPVCELPQVGIFH